MSSDLNRAIELRKQGNLNESNRILLELVKTYHHDTYIFYQCAWSFDVLGEETKAIPYYERAIELGLAGKDLEGAYLGLGNTYRTIGEYEKSKIILLKGITLFPYNKALPVFYSMTLYNLKEHSKAMEILLTCLVETTANEDIIRYKSALNFYANQLDAVWK